MKLCDYEYLIKNDTNAIAFHGTVALLDLDEF